ncbi:MULTISPECIES: transglycosylase domain-containing protein [Bacillus cereus group]|uniref:Penicillin-binding protein n=1 Tax=Bacillus cereus TaxID=1396 RepID=A0A9X6W2A4_BACCE|nr:MULTISPECIES: transglycosylase domain-containing protein [Bacillus cereus group]PFF51730.1 penicillin-binding protein [Bacillus cereus]PGB10145.1 penicillin-binding protein [Bacillus toyonensis]SME48686.1 Penicillin-binding protein 4 precursor [Bacillus cereus]
METREERGIKKVKEQKKKKTSKKRKVLKFFLGTSLVSLIGASGVFGYGYYKYGDEIAKSITKGYDKVSKINASTFNSKKSTQILDKDGNILKELKAQEFSYVSSKDMSPFIEKAFVSIEDERFYDHRGIDFKGLLRSVYTFVKSGGGTVQGGSTITQQLTKNVFLTMDRTMWRKIEEMVIAQELEEKYSKKEIMEFYVNNIYFGHGKYGIETASQYYFSKSAKDLKLSEVAMLSGVPNNPSIYDPVKNPEKAKKRRNIILFKMKELGYIGEKEYKEAVAEELGLNVNPNTINNQIEGSALTYAIDNAVKVLMEEDGFNFRYQFKDDADRKAYFEKYQEKYDEMRQKIVMGGFKIETSIDPKKQEELQNVVDAEMKKFREKDPNSGIYKKQSAVTTIDNTTGEVVAIVGGRTQEGNNFNRAYLGARQPGSTMKPLVAYTPAFERGYSPDSVLEDSEVPKGPRNWYRGYRGAVTVRHALESSINTIPFKLASEFGGNTITQYLTNMEFKYLTPQDNNPIIAVGGLTRGATTVEMASGYSTIARSGQFIRPTNVRKITFLSTNDVIYENDKKTVKVYDKGASYLMTDTMRSVLHGDQGTGKQANMSNYPFAVGKTGTTDSNKDSWFVGYTPYYTTAVYTGDDTPQEQSNSISITTMDIWRKFMEQIHEGLEVKDFEKPDTVFVQDGKLVNSLYTVKQKQNVRERNESKRIRKETNAQQERLDAEDYRIIHGLTKSEELERERYMKELITQINDFTATEPSQYDAVKTLEEDGWKRLDRVKHKSAYDDLKVEFNKSLRKVARDKANLEEKIRQEKLAEERRKQEEERKRLEEERRLKEVEEAKKMAEQKRIEDAKKKEIEASQKEKEANKAKQNVSQPTPNTVNENPIVPQDGQGVNTSQDQAQSQTEVQPTLPKVEEQPLQSNTQSE